jgi:hypothetical protein
MYIQISIVDNVPGLDLLAGQCSRGIISYFWVISQV